jgi:hypothetical protein
VSRIRITALALASTLAFVVATEVHGAAIGIMAGCAALSAGTAAWSSSTRGNQKNGHHPHVVTKKISRLESIGVNWRRLEIVSSHLQMSRTERFAARLSGLASGLALAVRTGAPEVCP